MASASGEESNRAVAHINVDTENEDDTDDEDDTFDLYQMEYTTLDEEVLVQLKQNDPTIDKLALCLDFAAAGNIFESNDINWIDEGHHIAKNTHIKVLAIDHLASPAATENTLAFYSAVSQIRTIKHLYIGGLIIGSRDIMKTLSPTFKYNRLRTLNVNLHDDDFTVAGAQHLSKALSKFTSLRKFQFNIEYGGADRLLAKIVTALDKHQNLRELALVGNYIGRNSYIALRQLLQSPTKLESLNLDGNITLVMNG